MNRREFLRGILASAALTTISSSFPGITKSIGTSFEHTLVPQTSVDMLMVNNILKEYYLPAIIENLYRPTILERLMKDAKDSTTRN